MAGKFGQSLEPVGNWVPTSIVCAPSLFHLSRQPLRDRRLKIWLRVEQRHAMLLPRIGAGHRLRVLRGWNDRGDRGPTMSCSAYTASTASVGVDVNCRVRTQTAVAENR